MWNDVKLAISGKSGCGNSTLSRLLSEKLQVRLINYTFHTIAQELGRNFEEFCLMAEKDSNWDKLVDQRQVQMANEGPCILGSRLAIWIWKEAEFRVFLEAPLEIRAQRIQGREGGNLAEVVEQTQRRDERDHERFLRLYNIDNDNLSSADLILPVGDLSPKQAAETIMREYARHRGLKKNVT